MATLPKNLPETAPNPGKPGRKRNPFDYAKSKQAFRRPSDFAAYLAGYPDFRAVSAYWYRLKPRIDLGRIGQREANIYKTADPLEMTEEFATRKWGRGLYMLKLTDENRPSGLQEVAKAWFQCDDPDLPPVYDPRTLVLNDPENADEVARLTALGVLTRDESGGPRVRTDATAPAPPPPAAVPSAVALAPAPASGLGDQVMLKLLDRVLPSATPQTAAEVLEQSFAIADRFKPASPAISVDQIVDAVAARLRSQQQPVAASSLMSDLETYERVSGLLDKVGAGRALNADGTPSWLGPVLESLVKPLLPLVSVLVARAGAPPPGPPPAAAQGAVVVEQPSPVPAVIAAPFPSFLTADAPIMDRVVQVAQLALQKSAEGVEGFRFASWLVNYYPGGDEVFRFLESSGGVVGCMGLIDMVPGLKGQVGDSAALEAWLEDFFTLDLDAGQSEEAAPPKAA